MASATEPTTSVVSVVPSTVVSLLSEMQLPSFSDGNASFDAHGSIGNFSFHDVADSLEGDKEMLVYPPTQEPTLRRLFITLYLIICLTVGICGNFSQLALQYYSYRLRIYRTTVSPNCTQLYISLLHMVYFLISISLPSVIIEHLVQIWMFGIFTCATHLLLVNTGRTAAAWLTVMLFFDQKLVIRQSKMDFHGQRRSYYVSLIFITCACFITALPSLIYIELHQEVLHEEYLESMVLKIRTFKCSAKIPPSLSATLSIVTFFIDFLVPLLAIVIVSVEFYCRAVRRSPSSVVFQEKLQNYRLLIAVLYFVAYCPHWTAVTWLFVGKPTETESALLADVAILFSYTLPAVIWFPLSCLSSTAASQARFYDTLVPQKEVASDPVVTNRSGNQSRRNVRWSAGDASNSPNSRLESPFTVIPTNGNKNGSPEAEPTASKVSHFRRESAIYHEGRLLKVPFTAKQRTNEILTSDA